MAVLAVLAWMAGAAPLAAQAPPAWLSGNWAAQNPAKAKGKGKAAAEPPETLHVEITGDTLRILENGATGEDIRCHLDGTEIEYRQAKPQATARYMNECVFGPQSVEVNGTMTAAVDGFPPREFELTKKYELAKDGSLRRHDQLWGLIPGLGRVAVSDTTTSFSKSK